MTTEPWTQKTDALMARIKLRDAAAFSEFYDLTSSKLYGLILKILVDEQQSLDALQEAYQKIWQNSEQHVAAHGTAWSWVCQLVRNHSIDAYRKQKRARDVFSDSDEREPIEPTDSDNLWPEYMDLGRCLSGIQKEKQSVILSAYVYGWSHGELVDKFKLPLGTIKSWIRRGLKELRECLEA